VWYFLGSAFGPGAWRIVFFLGVLPAFFVLYLRTKVQESEKWMEKRREREELQALRRAGASLSREQRIVAGFTLSALFRDAQLRKLALLCLVMALGTTVGFWGVSSWIPGYVESVAQAAGAPNPARWGGVAGILFTIGSIFGYVSAGFVADWLGRLAMLRILFAGALLTTPMVFLWTHSPATVAAAAGLNGAFTLGQFAWMAIYSPELFPTAVRATAVSLVFNAARFVSILGPLVSGYLITRLGGYSTSAVLFSSIYLVALCAVPFLPETRGKPLPG
jgi:MFS family permease